MSSVVIASVARTPIGSFQGALSSVAAPQLAAAAIQSALSRAGISGDQVSEVILGNVLQAGIGQAPARQASIFAGLPKSVPALTVNKVCGSGMKAIMLGVQSIQLGESEVVVAGGMESMSRVPYILPSARTGARMGHQQMIDAMIHDGLWDPYKNQHMGNCGELCAREWKFSREQQDAFAIQSYQRAQEAEKSGKFKFEIAPVIVSGKGGDVVVDRDEGPSKVQFDKIATLKPAFDKSGTVTAANASSLNDGAAVVVLMSEKKAKELGVKPLARVISSGAFAQDPEWFTTAPAEAMRRAMKKAGWSMSQVDLFEVNEAFAVVSMAARQELEIPNDRLNVWGGAISLGHPIGASGARIVVTLISALKDRGAKKGIAGICIGGGEATALCVELC